MAEEVEVEYFSALEVVVVDQEILVPVFEVSWLLEPMVVEGRHFEVAEVWAHQIHLQD